MTLRHQNRSRTTWTGTYGQEFCSAISASLSLFPHNAGNALPTASKLTCLLVDWLFYRHESPFRSPFSSIYHQLIVYPCLPETSATEFLWWHVFELEWCPTFLSFFWRSLGNDDCGIQYICWKLRWSPCLFSETSFVRLAPFYRNSGLLTGTQVYFTGTLVYLPELTYTLPELSFTYRNSRTLYRNSGLLYRKS